MEVQFPSEILAKLNHMAGQRGCAPDEVLRDVVADYFAEQDRFVEAVLAGEAALDRGEFLTHEQAGERLRAILQR